jgi:hypothetical protein
VIFSIEILQKITVYLVKEGVRLCACVYLYQEYIICHYSGSNLTPLKFGFNWQRALHDVDRIIECIIILRTFGSV